MEKEAADSRAFLSGDARKRRPSTGTDHTQSEQAVAARIPVEASPREPRVTWTLDHGFSAKASRTELVGTGAMPSLARVDGKQRPQTSGQGRPRRGHDPHGDRPPVRATRMYIPPCSPCCDRKQILLIALGSCLWGSRPPLSLLVPVLLSRSHERHTPRSPIPP